MICCFNYVILYYAIILYNVILYSVSRAAGLVGPSPGRPDADPLVGSPGSGLLSASRPAGRAAQPPGWPACSARPPWPWRAPQR